jgi:hypothetical protein
MKAAELARTLGFKRSGNQWLGCCVAHDDHNPSMIIFDGRNGDAQVRCLAGCSSADIIEALRARGVWQGGVQNQGDSFSHPLDDADRERRNREIEERDRKRAHLALRIWEDAVNPEGTPVERYLESRGLIWPDKASSIIRYHPRCPKGPAGSVEYVPALIALMRDVESFKPTAINRLFLDIDRNVKTGGMMLGLAGNAAMMITSRHDTFWDDLSFCPRLAVCEGLETGLAINRNARCVWALGSAGAIGRFPVIFGVGHIVICADNDADNLDSGFVAAIDCARRWNASSHQRATIMMPNLAGADFADCPIEV